MRILIFLLLAISGVYGQSLSGEAIKSAAHEHLPVVLPELREFLKIKNDGHYPDQISANLEWCLKALQKRKFKTTILYSSGVPHLFAERIIHSKLPKILVYMQIDGQSVAKQDWDQEDPYTAVLKTYTSGQWKEIDWNAAPDPDARIFARSASDSKGPAMAFLAALDILDKKKIKPTFNLKLILDFQEEMGSPTLPELVKANTELFDAQMVLIMDGARHVSNLPTLNFGARGIATITLKVFGPSSELHSGQYGNFAPNPVFKLSRLLAGMKDDTGRVVIPGFYDGVALSDEERLLLRQMPGDDAKLLERLGVARPDNVGSSYEESLQYPSLNVRGLKAATVEQVVRTIIPAEALAEIDIRLVPETEGERQVNLVRQYIESQGFHFVDKLPSPEERRQFDNLISFEYRLGSRPFRTDLNSPEGKWLSNAMDRVFGEGNYVKQRTTGGSQPIEPFISTLQIPAVSVRFPNPDNNIHAANENLRIGSFEEGIRMCLGILTQKSD